MQCDVGVTSDLKCFDWAICQAHLVQGGVLTANLKYPEHIKIIVKLWWLWHALYIPEYKVLDHLCMWYYYVWFTAIIFTRGIGKNLKCTLPSLCILSNLSACRLLCINKYPVIYQSWVRWILSTQQLWWLYRNAGEVFGNNACCMCCPRSAEVHDASQLLLGFPCDTICWRHPPVSSARQMPIGDSTSPTV